MTNVAYVDNLLLLATDTPGDFVGIGTTNPQGKFHVYDTTGSMIFVSKSGIVGSAVTIVADGAGDVTRQAYIIGVVTNSIPQDVGVNNIIALSGTVNATIDAGANNLRFTCSAAGALTVARTAGAATWSISVLVIWQ